ncbi:MAG: SIR2 family protein [Salinivirgaceae bacterium]|nr:SIR2 family protein [Salinivirgaceae bacterium]
MEEGILKELNHKVKSVSDLIRFISNTAHGRDGVQNNTFPNFSLLLGSGASVSSGIRSGQQLINDWKEEIKKETGETDIDEYLTKCSWFDSANEYASLFENRFDLQRQRRIFVENEVAEKSPSIGYAYLISLVNNGWFNTIFTTNFDDLINESFYRFSKRRPIVCAHDSSISAVTITSDRPKVIKLHGDYLFDNIKATLRETETLELNMQMKMREFAKNGGLIVIGYSGQDRSIMDILTMLVNQTEYFKNGIYWCLRKGDEDNICPELKKFLWRDRVFLVPIEGFDELMAQMNEVLNDGALPIRNELLSREHHDEIVRSLTTNSYIAKTTSPILKKACKQLSDSVEKNLVEDYLRFMNHQRADKQNTPKDSEPKFRTGLLDSSDKEKAQIQEWLTDAYIAGHRQKVLSELDALDILSLPDSQYKLELLELYMELTDELPDAKIKQIHDELIRLNPKNQAYYMAAASSSNKFSQKLDYLKMAKDKFPNDYYVYNRYVECLVDYKEGFSIAEEIDVKDEMIEDSIAKSIELNQRLSNSIWVSKARWLMHKYKYNKTKQEELCDILLRDVEIMHFKHPNMLDILNILKSKILNEEYFKNYIDFYANADNVDYLERCYISYIEWLQDNRNFDDVKSIFNECEAIIQPSNRYQRRKAQCFERYTLYEEALKIIEGLRMTHNDKIAKMRLLAKLERKSDLEEYYKSIRKPTDSMKMVYLDGMGQYGEIADLYKLKIKNNEYMSLNDISLYSYSLLQIKDYQSCYDFLSRYYAKPETCEPFIIVNYLMAKKQKTGKTSVDTDVKKKIIERTFAPYSDDVMAAGYSLISDKSNMLKFIRKKLDKNPDFISSCKKWPVLRLLLLDKDYAELEKYIQNKNIHVA